MRRLSIAVVLVIAVIGLVESWAKDTAPQPEPAVQRDVQPIERGTDLNGEHLHYTLIEPDSGPCPRSLATYGQHACLHRGTPHG